MGFGWIGRPALQRALPLTFCLAIGGASGAPDGVRLDVALASAVQSQSHETVDAAGPDGVDALEDVAQFDLECTSVGREVTDGPDGPGGEPPARPWIFNFRYFVDLGARKFCDPYWCEISGVWRIPAVDAETITFLNGRRDGFTLETVDRGSGRYVRRSVDGGREWLVEGTCRQEPFSGFPDTSEAILQDPWGPDGEWVGDDAVSKALPRRVALEAELDALYSELGIKLELD